MTTLRPLPPAPSDPVAGSICVLPVKRLCDAKTRLSGLMNAGERAQLQLAMLEDTLRAVSAAPSVRAALVVSTDTQVAQVAHRFGARIVGEPRSDLSMNAAVETGIGAARLWQEINGPLGSPVMILPGDIPLVSVCEIEALLKHAARERCVLVSSDRAGSGTNALTLPHPVNGLAAFGPGSCQRHLARAAKLRLAAEKRTSPGLGLDIDEERDIEAFLEFVRQPRHARTAPATQAWIRKFAGESRFAVTDTPADYRRPQLPAAITEGRSHV